MRDFHVVRRHAYRCLVRFGLAIVIALSAASQGSAAGWMSHSSALLDLKNDGPRRETPHRLTATGTEAATIQILAAGNTTPASLTFAAQEGGPPPAALWYCVANTGEALLTWQASPDAPWLHLDLTAFDTLPHDQNCGHASVTLDGLPAGTHHATVTVTAPGAGNSPQALPVTLVLDGVSPTLALDRTSLSFVGTEGAADAPDQAVEIRNAGSGTLTWSADTAAAWLSVSPEAGTAGSVPDSLTLHVDLAALAVGTHTATVTIQSAEAANSPRAITVSVTVNPAATASATLAWEGNGESDLAGYHVYRSTIPGTFGAPIATVSPATTTYTDSALALNTTFFWVVTAFDSLGNESVHSNEVSKSIY